MVSSAVGRFNDMLGTLLRPLIRFLSICAGLASKPLRAAARVSRMVWRDAGGVGEVRMSACALRSRASVSREFWSSSCNR